MEEIYVCEQCGGNLKQETDSVGLPKYICDTCEKTYKMR